MCALKEYNNSNLKKVERRDLKTKFGLPQINRI